MHICELIFTAQRAHCRQQPSVCIHTRHPFTTEATKWRTDKILTAAHRYGGRSGLIGIQQPKPGLGNDVLCLSEVHEDFNMADAFVYISPLFSMAVKFGVQPKG
jgi:hypothetical protein